MLTPNKTRPRIRSRLCACACLLFGLFGLLGAACGPGVNPAGLHPDAGGDGADAELDAGDDAGDDAGFDTDADAGADPADAFSGDDAVDAGSEADSEGSDQGPVSLCTRSLGGISCPHQTWTVEIAGESRQVHWQVPLQDPGPNGYPAVIFFQGAGFSSQWAWSGAVGEVYGAFYQAEAIAALLDAGYAIVAPEAARQGTSWWDTNIAPWASDWEHSADHQLMLALLAALEAGQFGPLDPDRLYALGFSSGGYMTSRMAVSYPGRFRALAIQSGSYATCLASACQVPDPLPADHPPTLFCHGLLDPVVPAWTMRLYDDALRAAGVPSRVVTDAGAGQQWTPDAPAAVVDWFGSID